MRPCHISRSGKRRTHTPSNAELRGTGLTVNKAQPHHGEPNRSRASSKKMELPTANPPQRLTESGERNLDPNRIDGPPPPRRVARAMVSTAPKGSIPTTLGGRMPPTSILSRREYGLRQLRK